MTARVLTNYSPSSIIGRSVNKSRVELSRAINRCKNGAGHRHFICSCLGVIAIISVCARALSQKPLQQNATIQKAYAGGSTKIIEPIWLGQFSYWKVYSVWKLTPPVARASKWVHSRQRHTLVWYENCMILDVNHTGRNKVCVHWYYAIGMEIFWFGCINWINAWKVAKYLRECNSLWN
jgi:hypothetical protein